MALNCQFFRNVQELTRGFLAAFAAEPVGRFFINKRFCLRFRGLILALRDTPARGLSKDHRDT